MVRYRKLVLNVGKSNMMKFITNNSSHSTLHIGNKENYIGERVNTKFLGLQIDNRLNWKNHIEQMISKLNGACHAVRLMIHISNMNTLKSIYYAYIHSTVKYGIIFGSNSAHSGKIITLQKKIFRIMAGAQPSTLCRNMFKNLRVSTCFMSIHTFVNELHYQ